MIDELNALVKKLNDEKPFINMPDWSLRINTLNHDSSTRIELNNDYVGTFYFVHDLVVVNGALTNIVSYSFCCEFKDSTRSEIEYRKTLETRFKELFPGE